MDSTESIESVKENKLARVGSTLSSKDAPTDYAVEDSSSTKEIGDKCRVSRENGAETQERRKKVQLNKAERELRKLEITGGFDNKKFNVDRSEADFTCLECGETFLYASQLESHRVYDHIGANLKPLVIVTREKAAVSDSALSYRCKFCLKLFPSMQTYLQHFEKKRCRDNEKRRLKTLDACICLLCGFGTSRSQLTSHLRNRHANFASTMVPTSKTDLLFPCPLCTTDGGGSVVLASGSDLLIHLSTWHPTAIVLEKGEPTSVKAKRVKKSVCKSLKPNRSNRQQIGHFVSRFGDGRRFCFICRSMVLRKDYGKHFGACKGKKPMKASKKLLKFALRPRKLAPNQDLSAPMDAPTEPMVEGVRAKPKPKIFFKHRFCFSCRKTVSHTEFNKHFGACKVGRDKPRDQSLSHKVSRSRPKSTSTVKNLRPLSIPESTPGIILGDASPVGSPEKLMTYRSLSASEPVTSPVEDAQASTNSMISKPQFSTPIIEDRGNSSALLPTVRKKGYNCSNCEKQFFEPLGYFIHLVNRFCRGNRGVLHCSFCPLCKEAIQSAPSMLDHLRRKHCGYDGLKVEKSKRIEFTELASEIIGFLFICSICTRGFYSKTRCNSSKPHLGSKVHIQEIVKCDICNLKLKSKVHLTLHMWAIHDLGMSQLSHTSSGNDLSKVEAIPERFTTTVYEDANTFDDFKKEPPMALKCSVCTTKFASLKTLEEHNRVFHEGVHRNDVDFHMISKIFFYRQYQQLKKGESLFDDLFKSPNVSATNAVSTVKDLGLAKGTSWNTADVNGMPTVIIQLRQPSQLKRNLEDIEAAKKTAKFYLMNSPSSSAEFPTVLPQPPPLQSRPMPPLVRKPLPMKSVKLHETIVVDEGPFPATATASSRTVVTSTGASSSINGFQPPTASPLLQMRAPTKPVVLRTFSLRSVAPSSVSRIVGPPNVTIHPSSTVSSELYRWKNTNPSTIHFSTPLLVSMPGAPLITTARIPPSGTRYVVRTTGPSGSNFSKSILPKNQNS